MSQQKFMPEAAYNRTYIKFEKLMNQLYEMVENDITKVKPVERMEFFKSLMSEMIKLTVAERKASSKDAEAARKYLKNKAGSFGEQLLQMATTA